MRFIILKDKIKNNKKYKINVLKIIQYHINNMNINEYKK